MQQLALPLQETLHISYVLDSDHFHIAVAMQTATPDKSSYMTTLLL